jgi:hypothetical protein
MSRWNLLILEIPPALEDALVDELLASGLSLDFDIQRVETRAGRETQLSALEQVSGRCRRIRMEILGECAAIDQFQSVLVRGYGQTGIRFRRLEVSDCGSI